MTKCERGFWWLSLGVLFLFTSHVRAMGPPAVTHVYPASLQQGTTIVLEVGGSIDEWPLKLWSDSEGITLRALDEKNKVECTVAEQVEPGLHWLRFYSDKGASKAIPLLIDWVPHLLEKEPNNSYTEAQDIPQLPQAVDGVLLKRGDADTYAVQLAAGETLVAAMDAHRHLLSPVDCNLQLLDARGNLLAQNMDHQGLDPRLVFQASQAGSYRIRVFGFPSEPNSTIEYDGKSHYVYRLWLTNRPFCFATLPLALTTTHANPLQFQFYGANPEQSEVPVDPGAVARGKKQVYDRRWSHHLMLPLANGEVVCEAMPSSVLEPQLVPAPCSVTGVIEVAGDQDAYRWEAKAGTGWRLRMESRSLGYPLDAVMVLRDGSGKELLRVDDLGAEADPSLVWKSPADGLYEVVIEDLYGQGSIEHFYRLTIELDAPMVELSITDGLLAGEVGKPLEIPVTVTRKGNDSRKVQIALQDLPPGVTCEPIVSDGAGESAKLVKLIMQATGPVQTQLSIVGNYLPDDPAKEGPPAAAASGAADPGATLPARLVEPISVTPLTPAGSGIWLSILNPVSG